MKKIIYVFSLIPLTVFAFPFFGSPSTTTLQNNPEWLKTQSEIQQGQQNIQNNSKITQQNINARSQAIGNAVANMSNNPAENNALAAPPGTTATTVRTTTPTGTQIQKIQTTTTPQPALPPTPSGFPVNNSNNPDNKNNYQYGF